MATTQTLKVWCCNAQLEPNPSYIIFALQTAFMCAKWNFTTSLNPVTCLVGFFRYWNIKLWSRTRGTRMPLYNIPNGNNTYRVGFHVRRPGMYYILHSASSFPVTSNIKMFIWPYISYWLCKYTVSCRFTRFSRCGAWCPRALHFIDPGSLLRKGSKMQQCS